LKTTKIYALRNSQQRSFYLVLIIISFQKENYRMNQTRKFTQMKLDPQIVKALKENEIVSPTEIQQKSIQIMLQGSETHVVGQARTGSGKTLAYAIPMVQNLRQSNKHVQSLVMVPTRELCKQVSKVFRMVSKYKKAKIVEVYGGVSIKNQIQQLRNGGQIVIATPGRLIDLYHRRQISFRFIHQVALDEADRMLDMGFLPDMRTVLLEAMRGINPQLMLFSATLLDDIKKLVRSFNKGKKIVEINVSEDNLVVEKCEQQAYLVSRDKYKNFVRILKKEDPAYSIIFARTKRKTKQITRRLKQEQGIGLKIAYLNGDLSQSKREKITKKFRNKQLNCLVGTNVLARGLDFPAVSHVFNYDLPRDPEIYVHRIGRTARVSGEEKDINKGKAISIIGRNDRKLLKDIESLMEKRITLCKV